MLKRGWLCLLAVALCSLRAWQLYRASTMELRASQPLQRDDSVSANTFRYQPVNDSTMGDSSSNLFYFIQISDLHLSKFRAAGHTLHFLHFIQSIVPVVKPSFVMVTGDLTDAKDIRRITSQQYIEEWQVYKNAIDQGAGGVPWYDMRGNHDCFDLPSWQSHVNLYRTFGKSGSLVESGKGVYSWEILQPYGKYRFVAIDACPKRGPSRPFNFFGYLTSKTMDRLSEALRPADYNHTFLFSHYPTTTMVFGVSSQGQGFRDLARRFSIYFCGHLHQLTAGLGDVLKWYDSKSQSLELELGDMMVHGVYRIVAVDHDMISFIDTELPVSQLLPHPVIPLTANNTIIWPERIQPSPVILITNPKDARYALPNKEPLQRILGSSHIRFLVFAQNSQDMRVQVQIDGKDHPYEASFVEDALWTVPWNPELYHDKRTHTLQITVTTPDGQTAKATSVFRLDGRRAKIAGGPGEFIIASNMSIVLKGLTMSAIFVMIFLLVMPTFYSENTAQRLVEKIHVMDQVQASSFFQSARRNLLAWAVRFIEFPRDQTTCWCATFLFLLSLLSLPWFRAEFIPSAPPQERHGTFYLWGLKFADEWVPIADTWMFAAEQIWLNVVVFFFLFTWKTVDSSDLHCRKSSHVSGTRQWHEYPWFKSLEMVYWLWRTSELIALASFYGGIPTLVYNVLVLWIVFVGITLAWGKGGVFTLHRRKRFGVTCCQDIHVSISLDDDSGRCSSSSSSSPSSGSPRAKSRKKHSVKA